VEQQNIGWWGGGVGGDAVVAADVLGGSGDGTGAMSAEPVSDADGGRGVGAGAEDLEHGLAAGYGRWT